MLLSIFLSSPLATMQLPIRTEYLHSVSFLSLPFLLFYNLTTDPSTGDVNSYIARGDY
jgi:hypothetical protein